MFGNRFFERADPFEVWFGLVSRLLVWGRRDGHLVARNPLDNLDATPVDRGLVAVVSVVLGSTAYDSLSAAVVVDSTLEGTLVLAGFVLLVALSFSAAAVVATGLARSELRALPGLLAHSLVPIGVGYLGAHYLTLLLESGQRYVVYLSDPLVTGRHDYLGTIDWGTSYFLCTSRSGGWAQGRLRRSPAS